LEEVEKRNKDFFRASGFGGYGRIDKGKNQTTKRREARILYALIQRPMCVRDLAILVGVSASGVSHQLRFLRDRRLVKPRREGNTIYYQVDDHHVAALFKEAGYHIDHVRQGIPDHPYP
jgi:DNA-binding transcriptional ArsR family regulator